MPYLTVYHYTPLGGHLHNLFTELPHILTGDLKTEVQHFRQSYPSKDKVTGADLQAAAVYLLLLLQNKSQSAVLTTLMETIVRVSEIMYSPDSARNPHTILQLYNCTWLHHELCLKLFSSPCELSQEKFFGTYLHDLSCHAGL